MTLPAVIQREVLTRFVHEGFHAKNTAKSLGVGSTTIYRWLAEWGLMPIVPARVFRLLEALNTGGAPCQPTN